MRVEFRGMKGTYTTEEAAAALGVSSARVRQLILDGVLKTERFGRAHVITREALEAARHRQTTPGPAPKAKAEKAAKKGRKK
jgi:excisionase family DNA binding protein